MSQKSSKKKMKQRQEKLENEVNVLNLGVEAGRRWPPMHSTAVVGGKNLHSDMTYGSHDTAQKEHEA